MFLSIILKFSGQFLSSNWQVFFWWITWKYYSAARGRWKIWLQCQQQVSILYWGMCNLFPIKVQILQECHKIRRNYQVFLWVNYKVKAMGDFNFCWPFEIIQDLQFELLEFPFSEFPDLLQRAWDHFSILLYFFSFCEAFIERYFFHTPTTEQMTSSHSELSAWYLLSLKIQSLWNLGFNPEMSRQVPMKPEVIRKFRYCLWSMNLVAISLKIQWISMKHWT